MFYKTWIYDWNLNSDVIEYAVTLAFGKYMPMQYLNNVLSRYHTSNVNSVDEAKKIIISNTSTQTTTGKEAKKREYTKEELDSLFDNIYEIEI